MGLFMLQPNQDKAHHIKIKTMEIQVENWDFLDGKSFFSNAVT